MGLEAATHISDLVSTNPAGTDQKLQGDDHIRMIKSVLKTDFPNINAAVTGTPAQLNAFSGLFPFTAGDFISASGASTLQKRSAAQVRSDVGADNASNITSGTLADARLSSNVPLKDTAATITATYTFSGGTIRIGIDAFAGTVNCFLNAAAGNDRVIAWQTGGATRWQLYATATAESGGNVGSDLNLRLRDDAAAVLATHTFRRTLGNLEMDTPAGVTRTTNPEYSFSGDNDTGLGRQAANVLSLVTAGNERFRVGASGQLGIGGGTFGTAKNALISGGAGAAPSWGPIIDHGVYTPTLTNGANVAASTARQCMWTQIGDKVHVVGQIEVDPTLASTTTTIDISLPVASNLANAWDLNGNGSDINGSTPYWIGANTANDRAQMTTGSIVGTVNRTVAIDFTYQVL